MKKLMIAAAIVCAAAFAQAATMDWGIDFSYDYNGKGDTDEGTRGTAQTYLVYLFDNATYTRDTLMSDIAGAGANWSKKINEGAISGAAGSTGAMIAASDSSIFTVTDDKASAYLVIFNAATVDAADHVYVTAVDTATVPSAGVAGKFQWDGDRDLVDMNGPASWTAVPEPTSGLLLLLGVAGLALRRRRA